MGKVPGVNGNTYEVEVSSNKADPYVKIAGVLVTRDIDKVHLFLKAYKMGRDHKKTEIRNALNI